MNFTSLTDFSLANKDYTTASLKLIQKLNADVPQPGLLYAEVL